MGPRRRLAATAVILGCGIGPLAAADVPVAIRARLTQDAKSATLTFDLSSSVVPEAFVLASPDRAIIDLPEVNFQVAPQPPRNPRRAGLVQTFRYGLFAPGRSRIVIDLSGPARVVKTKVEPIADGAPSRLVIELGGTDNTAFAAAAAQAARVEEARAEIRRQHMPATGQPGFAAKPMIVIDPGHGGVDAGASSADGVLEKDVVYALCQKLAETLKGGGKYDVALTRAGDMFVSLDDRVQIARNAHAALFVSIHADALAANTQVSGATVYTVSDRASDAEAARIAESENKADVVGGGVAQAKNSGQVADILFDLTRRETRTYTHVFTRTLISYLKNVQKLNNNPVRSAGFVVLKAPEIPSVLIELGYMSSRADVKSLQSPEWREKASGSIATAVDRFFQARRAGEAVAAMPDTVPPLQQVGEIARSDDRPPQ